MKTERGTGRGGFSLIELLTVMVVIGILASIAVPHLRRAIVKARAAEVVGSLDAVQVAMMQYLAEEAQWPPEASVGQIPTGLDSYLPVGFEFEGDGYEIDYDDLSGDPLGFVGLTVVTAEQELGQMVLVLLGDSNTWTNGSDRYTWVLDWET